MPFWLRVPLGHENHIFSSTFFWHIHTLLGVLFCLKKKYSFWHLLAILCFFFLHLGTFRHFLLLYWTFSSFDTFPPYVLPLLGTSLHLLALFPRIFWQTVWFLNYFFKHFFALSFSFFWLFGTVWHFSEHFGTFWHAIKIQKRPEIKDMAHLIFIFICVGPIWTILDQFGAKFYPFRPLCTIFFYQVGAIWKYLEQFWAIWSFLELFGDIWSCLEPSVVIWSQV